MEIFATPLTATIAILIAVAASSTFAYLLGRRKAAQAATELESLNEAGRQLLRSQLDVAALCEMVYWQAGQIVPCSLFQLGLFEDDDYHVVVWLRDSIRIAPQRFAGAANKGIVGWVRKTGQPLLIRDFASEREQLPAFPEFELPDPPRSGLFVPLIAGASTIGVMSIQSRQASRFNEEQERILTLLANQAASAISNAQLLQRAQRRAEQLNLIADVAAQISSLQPLDDLLKQIVVISQEKFGYYCVNIFILDSRSMRVGASTSSQFAADAPIVPLGKGLVGWAAKHSETALANSVADDRRYRRATSLPETKSEISIPLIVESRILGVLDVQSDSENAFGKEDVFVLETLAAQIGLAIEQAQTYEAEHSLAQRLEALIRVSQALVSVLDLDELLDRLVDLISDTFGYKRVHIFLRIGEELVFRAGTGPHSVRWLIDGLVYTLADAGLIPRSARQSKPALVGDTRRSRDYRAGPGLEDTRSELVVPIIMVNHVLGVIDLQSESVNAFSSEDLVLMRSLADSVAVAVRNAALYAGERRRSKLAETLRATSAAIASDLNLDRLLAEILERLGTVVTLDTAAILLAEEGASTLTIMATLGRELEGIVGHQLPIEELESDDPEELKERVSQVYHDLLQLQDDHSCISAPLLVGGTLIGFLLVDRHSASLFADQEQEIVFAFASQASVAINNARLYSAQQSEAWVTTALLQVAEAVNAQVQVAESLETIARLTALLAGVSSCVILRWNSDSKTYTLGAHYSQRRGTIQSTQPLDSENPFLDLASVAEQSIGAGPSHYLDAPMSLKTMLGSESMIALPLRAKRQLVGLLVVDETNHGSRHDPRLMTILTGIAHQTATALASAVLQEQAAERDRLEQELKVAHQIQASFIPLQSPMEPGWDLAATWRAARQVSGDFYDFIPLANGLWGLVIGDVADKGMPAAIFMAMCRTLLRAVAVNRTSASDTLQRANELIFRDSHSDLFVTIFYAVWNPRFGTLTYASAGHNPPLLVGGSTRKIRELRCKGIALGVLPEVELEEKTVELKSGDLVLAYTDGITEAMQASHNEWGIEKLKKIVRAADKMTSADLAASIIQAIDEFVADAPQSDDITMWVLKRL